MNEDSKGTSGVIFIFATLNLPNLFNRTIELVSIKKMQRPMGFKPLPQEFSTFSLTSISNLINTGRKFVQKVPSSCNIVGEDAPSNAK